MQIHVLCVFKNLRNDQRAPDVKILVRRTSYVVIIIAQPFIHVDTSLHIKTAMDYLALVAVVTTALCTSFWDCVFGKILF